LPAYLILLDRDYRIPYMNRFFRERFGDSGGRRCHEYLFHREAPCDNCRTYDALKNMAPLEWEWTGPDGRNYYIYDYPFKDADGSDLIMEVGIDITLQKRAQEELRRANEYNRSLIEASLDPLVTIGADGRVTDVNSATEAVTGQPRQKLIGTDFADYFTDPEKARLGYRRVFDEGSVRDYPLDIRHGDGHVTSVLYNASVYRDRSGEVIGVFAAARDITELQRAEAELRRHKEDLERLVRERTAELERRSGELDAILTSIADPVVVYDRARTPTRLNAAARELLGDGAPENRARRAEGNAESADRVAVSLALRGETVRDVEYSITDQRGWTRTFLGSCAPILDKAGVAGAVSTMHEVTDLKEADRAMQQLVTELATVTGEAIRRTDELNSILSAVAVPVVVFDPDGDPVKANPAFQAFFGFDPLGLPGPEFHERLDRRIQRTGPSASAEAVRAALRGTPAIYREQHSAGEGGSARTLQVSCSPILAGGKPAGAVCSWQDIAR
jgi:PAS domain S-box-containing protein